MTSASELDALLAATAQGDRAAFARFYELTAPKLLGVVLRIIRDPGRAEDVVQDAYLKVWRGAASFSPDSGSAMGWLVSIARNRAIDLLRSRAEAVAAAMPDDAALALIPDPEDRAGRFLESQRIGLCLDRLDAMQRECFLSAYLDGYSREELATRFGRPVNTIKTWLHRSAAALRSCLGEP